MIFFSVVGYYAIVAAMRIGDVSSITPFRYSRLVFSLIIGILIFGEQPDWLTYTGATLIIGSGLYSILRERRLAPEIPRNAKLLLALSGRIYIPATPAMTAAKLIATRGTDHEHHHRHSRTRNS